MKCAPFRSPDGQVSGFLCGGRQRKTCKAANCGRPASRQCDHPVKRNDQPGTCDMWLCERCAHPMGPNRDYCPGHYRASQGKGEQLELTANREGKPR